MDALTLDQIRVFLSVVDEGSFPKAAKSLQRAQSAVTYAIRKLEADWPLAGTHRGHAGLAEVLQKASDEVEMTYPEPPEFVAQGDRVMVVGVATGKIKATK